MKKPALWCVCILTAAFLFLAGSACECPIKRLLGPKTIPAQKAPTNMPSNTTTRPAKLPNPTSLAQAVDQARYLNKPIYLEFSAPWCIPCRLYESSVLKSAAGKQALQNVVFLHVNVDKNTDLAGRFQVNYVPTGLLLKPDTSGGDVIVLNRHVGTLSLEKLQTFLSQRGS